jgi:DNA-directed RNA polymerase specialized sigma24 family protein
MKWMHYKYAGMFGIMQHSITVVTYRVLLGASSDSLDHQEEETAMHQIVHIPREEELLVERCLRGDETAWDLLFNMYHPRLVSIIRSLTRGGYLAAQPEEIAAEVWCTLCHGANARLRHFNPRMGRLIDYLAGIARRELWNLRRAERNRRFRENRVARREAMLDHVERSLIVQEFLDTLTHREREFCLCDLMKQPGPRRHAECSQVNGRQLRCRVLKKFQAYCNHRQE